MKNNNYIAANKLSAINTHGDILCKGDLVSHEGADDTALIIDFYIDEVFCEVRANTTKGFAGIDFLTKIQEDETENTTDPELLKFIVNE